MVTIADNVTTCVTTITIYVSVHIDMLHPLHSHTHVGSVMEHWLKDESVDNCMKCKTVFGVIDRKHHCRDCGRIFCNK